MVVKTGTMEWDSSMALWLGQEKERAGEILKI